MAGPLQARRDYEAAVRALGMRISVYVLPVVLSWWTVADLLKRHGGNAMSMQGRVMAGLDVLADWYFPSAGEGFELPALLEVADPLGSDLPPERLGRRPR